MSTTFNVFPKFPVIPTLRQIVDLSTERLHQYLSGYSIDTKYSIEVMLRSQEPDVEQPTELDSPANWADDLYAWFYVPSSGGTDAYFWEIDEEVREMVVEECHIPELPEGRRALILACLENYHYWHFRRAGSALAVINVAYGLIAASVAELTGGFIYSVDGGWDYERFPATAEEFYQWYFRPELAISHEAKTDSERCLKAIAGETAA
jgi:hypothetical protein